VVATSSQTVSTPPQQPATVTAAARREVSFKTAAGRFLCADLSTADARLVADRPQAGPWETFSVESAGGDRIHLRAANGKYVAAEDGGGRELVANRPSAGPWETFTIVEGEGAAVMLKTDNGRFVRVQPGDAGIVTADADSPAAAAAFTPSAPLILKIKPGVIAGRLRVDNRFFVNDAGTFRPIFTSALSLLRKSDDETRAFLDWTSRTGFNGIRVFAGALEWAGQTAASARDRLPFLLAEAARRGLYVEVTAITDSAGGSYDPAQHFRACAEICDRVDNAILEVANEPYHGTQADAIHKPERLLAIGQASRLPFALGAAADDESTEMAGGSFVTIHLDRGRDKWNQVRRVRELASVSESSRKPAVNNEPIGAAEGAQPGKRESDPAFFFCMGALNRLFEIGGVFHSEAGLNGVLPGPVQQSCAEAFVAGSRIVPVEDRLGFMNAKWAQSPVADARFDVTVVRAYTGVAGARAWTVLVGVSGDPGLQLGAGWKLKEKLAERPGVQVLELAR
jgi:hypothetical protein